MIASEARTRAAQTNGRKSQGPVTPEGKAISRANSLKHGMTGAGVVLPLEDAAEVSNLFDDLHAQFNPATPLGKILVQRIALSAVRLKRAAEEEAAYLGEKIRHAKDDYDDQRRLEIATLIANLDEQPSVSVRRLLRSPDGIDALIHDWTGLRDNLTGSIARLWTAAHCQRANMLTGRHQDEVSVSRINVLSEAIWGDFGLLEAHEGAGLDDKARKAWAKSQMIALIDEELTTLRDCRAGLDLDSFEQDREDAPRRAMFDTSKHAILARRYEAANERNMFKALKELQKVEKEAAENPQPSPAYRNVPLGSFRPNPEAPPEPEIGPETEAEEVLKSVSPAFPRSNRVEFAEESIDSSGLPGVVTRVPLMN